MADFELAHKKVMGHEGGYANNPADKGQATYKGIARKYHPKWGGWRYIDGCLAQITKQPTHGTPEYKNWVKYVDSKLQEINALQSLVVNFYKDNFWQRLGELEHQDLATWVYDKDVNTGSKGSRWLQQAVGVTVDGVVGGKTIAAANERDGDVLLGYMREEARDFYTQLAANDQSQQQFLKGWLARV
jgi:lysozyme family protein